MEGKQEQPMIHIVGNLLNIATTCYINESRESYVEVEYCSFFLSGERNSIYLILRKLVYIMYIKHIVTWRLGAIKINQVGFIVLLFIQVCRAKSIVYSSW